MLPCRRQINAKELMDKPARSKKQRPQSRYRNVIGWARLPVLLLIYKGRKKNTRKWCRASKSIRTVDEEVAVLLLLLFTQLRRWQLSYYQIDLVVVQRTLYLTIINNLTLSRLIWRKCPLNHEIEREKPPGYGTPFSQQSSYFTFLMDAIIFFTLNELVDQRVGYLRRLLYSVPYSLKFIISFYNRIK